MILYLPFPITPLKKNVWSLFYDDFDDPVPDIGGIEKFNKYVIKLSSSERVRWVLGMLLKEANIQLKNSLMKS